METTTIHKHINQSLNRRTELVGQRVGKLVIIGPAPYKGKCRRSWWLCKCDCGNEKAMRESVLLNPKKYMGCGCLAGQHVASDTPELAAIKDRWSKSQVWRYYQYKYAATKRNLSFNLTPEQFEQITKLDCAYCGRSPQNKAKTPTRDTSKRRNNVFLYNGIDRIDSSRGYEPTNVAPCCKQCNLAKLDYTLPDFLDWITRVHNHLQQYPLQNPYNVII